jgi:hypothetical protein
MNSFTIAELSIIFGMSRRATIRFLKYTIGLKTKERYKTNITYDFIKNANEELFHSIQCCQKGYCSKPFWTIQDLCSKLFLSHSGVFCWIKRNNINISRVGNKYVLFSSNLLPYQSKTAPKLT